MSHGITPDSASKAFDVRGLVAPLIDRRHIFCSVVSFAAVPRPLVLVSFDGFHTEVPYAIAGHTMAVDTCLAL